MSSRKKQAQDKIREQRKVAEQARLRRRRMLVGVTAIAVAVLVAGIGALVQAQRAKSPGSSSTPAGLVDGIGFAVGQSTAKVTIDMYEDFQCPACQHLEATDRAQLAQLVAAGTLQIIYRPISFLDGKSTTRYSTRALNAVACATGHFQAFHDLLYANQPAEGSAGLGDDQLIAYGKQAGVTDPGFASCVTSLRYEAWTVKATDASSKAGVNSTPTVMMNGKQVDPAQLISLINTAAAG